MKGGPKRYRPCLHHLRARNGRHEIDLIAELSTGSVVAIEIKATAAPKAADARHLAWLRDQLGDPFLAGAVLHTGPRPFVLGERIFALPICAIWGEGGRLARLGVLDTQEDEGTTAAINRVIAGLPADHVFTDAAAAALD